MAENEEAAESDTLEEDPENLLEDDAINDREEGFMKGYDDTETKEESDDVKEDSTEKTDDS